MTMFGPQLGRSQTFSNQDHAAIAQAVRAEHGALNEETLKRYADDNPTTVDAEVIQAMLTELASGAGKKQMGGAAGAIAAKSKMREKRAKIEAEFNDAFRHFVIGQDHAVKQLAEKMAARQMLDGDDPVPANFALPGPPGVGKTESIRAMANAIHGDPTMYVEINCSQYKKPEDLTGLCGSPPGYAGTGKCNDDSPISPKNIQAKFGDKRPILILWDEFDKAGPQAQKELAERLGNFLQSGEFQFVDTSCPTLKVPNVVNFFTSNHGMETASGLKGKSLRDHYIKEMRSVLPQHILSRLGKNFIGYDSLSSDDLRRIASLKVNKKLKGAEKRVADEKGQSIQLKVSNDVLQLFAEMSGSDALGARPLEELIRDFVLPTIGEARRKAQSGEVWSLEIKKQDISLDGTVKEVDKVGLNRMKRAFLEGLKNGTAPEDIGFSEFPIEFRCLNPKRALHDYEGEVPHTAGARMFALGSGAIGGRGYMMVNRGGVKDENEMFLLRPGQTEGDDRFIKVKNLPSEIATANVTAQVAALDDKNSLFYAVNVAPDKDEPEITTYLGTAGKGGIKFEKVQTPGEAISWDEMALVGGSLVGGDGKAMLWGGRNMEKTVDGSWSLDPDPAKMLGEAIQNSAFLFDLETKQWTNLPDSPESGRVGSATTFIDGKFYFIGGEEVVRDQHHQVDASQSSTAVDVYNIETGEFSEGPVLPNGVQWASAYTDSSGSLYVIGGEQLRDGGRLPDPTKITRTLGANGDWLEERIPENSLRPVVIPHVEGDALIGPFGEGDAFQMLRPSRDYDE